MSSTSAISPLKVLCTGDWRKDNNCVEDLKHQLEQNKSTRGLFSVEIFPQELEGSNQAVFLCKRLFQAELLYGEGPTLFLSAGQGSTQATVVQRTDTGCFEVLYQDKTDDGYPKEQPVVYEEKIAMGNRIKAKFANFQAISLNDSIYHVLKDTCPVIPNKAPLPAWIKTTGKDFPLGYVTNQYPNTPTLCYREFVIKDKLRKGTFVLADHPTIDLGTGKVSLVDPETGVQIKNCELPTDWQNSPSAMYKIVNILEDFNKTFENCMVTPL
jgi:hypothetical protein